MQLPQVKPAALQPEPTEVGSYFVANYPPFSVWQPDHVGAARQALAATGDAKTPLGLYLHIPFCRKRCKFCYYRVYTDKNAEQVEVYADALAREIALYADCPALAGRQFEFVYFGGGTPSFLSNQQLERLIERIRNHWRWDAAREVTFECEPGTLKESKLATIRSIGVTRLSLGVEHFDDAVLELNGRAHKSPEIFRAYEWARRVGFPQINIDLIAGMVGDTDAKWTDTLANAVRLAPDSVTIYQMELPHNAVFSRESRAHGVETPVADWATKRRWMAEAFAAFESAGYEVSSAYTLVKKNRRAGFVYRDSLWHGADMIGTGVASFSHFAGVHYQNHDQWDDYVGTVDRGELPIARALSVSKDELLTREWILQLKTGEADTAYFKRKFGVDVRQRFGEALDELAVEGLLEGGNGAIRLTREALLRVDALLPRFFASQYREIRYT